MTGTGHEGRRRQSRSVLGREPAPEKWELPNLENEHFTLDFGFRETRCLTTKGKRGAWVWKGGGWVAAAHFPIPANEMAGGPWLCQSPALSQGWQQATPAETSSSCAHHLLLWGTAALIADERKMTGISWEPPLLLCILPSASSPFFFFFISLQSYNFFPC